MLLPRAGVWIGDCRCSRNDAVETAVEVRVMFAQVFPSGAVVAIRMKMMWRVWRVAAVVLV